MKHGEFKIACHFYTSTGKQRCTDVGQRTIVAIRIDENPDDLSWLSGPPYAKAEIVFDEYDMPGCHFTNIWGKNESRKQD